MAISEQFNNSPKKRSKKQRKSPVTINAPQEVQDLVPVMGDE